MTLRKKVLLLTGIIFLFLIGILSLATKALLFRSFSEVESKSAGLCTEWVLNALKEELADLEATAADWAEWDDTYAFVENPTDEYLKANLVDSTFTNLRLNFMLFLNSSGQIVFGKGFDRQKEREAPVPESLREKLSAGEFLFNHSRRAGVILLPENPLLIASCPILTSEKKGPARGALVLGRYLDAGEIERLAQMTHAPPNLKVGGNPVRPPAGGKICEATQEKNYREMFPAAITSTFENLLLSSPPAALNDFSETRVEYCRQTREKPAAAGFSLSASSFFL